MTFERSRDYALIRAIVTEPRSYRAASDDFAPPACDFELNDSPDIWYLLAIDDGAELLGLFAFVPQNRILYEGHTCLLPCAYGRAARALRGAIAWMFANSGARRIVGATPRYLRLAVKLTLDAGLTPYGVNPSSFMRGGKLHDLVLTGISKEPFCPS